MFYRSRSEIIAPGSLVDALIFKSYIDFDVLASNGSVSSDCNRNIVTANLSIERSVFLGTRLFRQVVDIHDCPSSRVTEHAAPRASLEGPDIALSGRQILLK